jgi:hypothetical protein
MLELFWCKFFPRFLSFERTVQYIANTFSLQSSEKLGRSIPSHAGECCPPPMVPGGTHSLAGEGVGGPNSDEGTDTVILKV